MCGCRSRIARQQLESDTVLRELGTEVQSVASLFVGSVEGRLEQARFVEAAEQSKHAGPETGQSPVLSELRLALFSPQAGRAAMTEAEISRLWHRARASVG